MSSTKLHKPDRSLAAVDTLLVLPRDTHIHNDGAFDRRVDDLGAQYHQDGGLFRHRLCAGSTIGSAEPASQLLSYHWGDITGSVVLSVRADQQGEQGEGAFLQGIRNKMVL